MNVSMLERAAFVIHSVVSSINNFWRVIMLKGNPVVLGNVIAKTQAQRQLVKDVPFLIAHDRQ